MIAQIDKYGAKLFADPIAVQTSHGPLWVQPQRTNNILERFFRDFRRDVRRRTGHNSMSQFLQSMIADTPLVRNLKNPQYLKVLLNGRPDLESCFAHIDIELVRIEMLTARSGLDRLPAQLRQIIAAPAFPEALHDLFQKPLAPPT
jgi:hypothetical protein